MPPAPKKINTRKSAVGPAVDARPVGRTGAWAQPLPDLCGRLLRDAGSRLGLGTEHEISLVLCDGPFIRRLNRDWRDKDRATDVLSFPLHETKPGVTPPPGSVGDIIVCLPRARSDAREEGADLHEHLARLLIHGLLHLLGYDHVRETDYRRMKSMEERLLHETHPPSVHSR